MLSDLSGRWTFKYLEVISNLLNIILQALFSRGAYSIYAMLFIKKDNVYLPGKVFILCHSTSYDLLLRVLIFSAIPFHLIMVNVSRATYSSFYLSRFWR